MTETAQQRRKLLDLAYEKVGFSAGSALILSSLVVAALWPLIDHARLLVWQGAMVAIQALNFARARRYASAARDIDTEAGKWRVGLVAGGALAGLCWVSTIFSFPSTPFNPQPMLGIFFLPSTPFDPVTVLLMFILAGVTAYASVAMAFVPALVIAFLSCALLPLSVWLISFGEQMYIVMGLIVLSYLGVMLLLSRRMYDTVCKLISVSAENQGLRAEQSLNEQRMIRYFQSAPGFFFTLHQSANGRYSMSFASTGIRKLLGLTPEAVEQDFAGLGALIHPEDRPRIFRLLERSAFGLTSLYVECRINHPDKGLRWIEVNALPQREDDGGTRWEGFMLDITERRRVAEALRGSEEKYRVIFESANDGIFLHRIIEGERETQFILHDLNQKGCELWGNSREDILSGNFDLLALNNPPYSYREAMRRNLLAATGHAQLFDWQLKRPDGSVIWGEVNLHRVQIGGEAFLLAVMRDVSERKCLEMALVEREQEFRTLAENFPDVVIRYDLNLKRVYANPALAELAGVAACELLGKTPRDATPLTDPASYMAELRKVIESGIPSDKELPVRRLNGDIAWYLGSFVPEFDARGHLVGVLMVARDITERKAMEKALHDSEQMLQEAQRIAHVGSWDVDMVNDKLTWSDEIFRIWEIDKTKFKADFVAFVETVHPEDRARVAQVYNDAVVNHSLYEVEHRLLFPDGRVKHILEQGEPQYDAQGKPVRFIGTSLDITERKQIEQYEQFRSHLLEFIAGDHALPRILDELVRGIEQLNPGILGSILLLKGRHLHLGAAPSLPDFYNEAVEGLEIGLGVGSCGTAAATGERVIVEDIQTHPYWAPYNNLAALAGLGACWSQPIHAASGQVLGTFAIYHRAAHTPSATEIVLIEKTANLASVAIERKQAAEALQSSEQLMRTVIDATPDWIFIKDQAHRYRLVNQGYANALHLAPADFIGKNDLDLGFPEELVKGNPEKGIRGFWADDRLVMDSNGAQVFADDPATIDGEVHTFHTIKIPLHDANEKPWGVLAFARDITERKRMEEELKEKFERISVLNQYLEENSQMLEAQAVELAASQEQIKMTEAWYRSIVRSAPDGMVVVNESGNISLVNENLLRLFGNEESELIGYPLEVLLPLDARQAHVAQRDGFFGSGAKERPMSFMIGNLRACRKDGTEFPVDVSLSRLPDADGRSGVVCAAIRDVTERKCVEDALQRREWEFRTLAENSPDAIMRYDRECRRVYVNPVCVKLMDKPAHDLLGKRPVEYPPTPHAVAYEAVLWRVLENGVPAEHEYIWPNKGEAEVISQFSIVPEFNADGQILGLLAIGRDITERKQMEATLTAREQESRTLVDHSPDTISRYDLNCRRVYVNPTFAAMIEGGAASLLGKTPSECPGGENAVGYERKIQEVLASGVGAEFELKWTGREGKEICSHVRIAAERDASGEVISVLAVGRDITELNAFRQQIHHMAFHDALTSLPNRVLFNDRLRQMLSEASWYGQQAGVMLLDLDRFKIINDTMGHPAGDELLREAAARLTGCVRVYDTVARLGGDEFAILLPDVRSADDLGRIASKIFEVFMPPFFVESKEIFVTASLGISVYPDDSEKADDLIKNADSAMYLAKRSGRNGFRFYSKELTTSANERLTLESDLRRALGRQELALFYQPKVSLHDGVLQGSEALLRWIHPTRGMVPPDQFIGIAEDSGLILEIGEWVLRTACLIACEWNGAGKPLHKVAINLSARQFQSGDLVATVCHVLEETGCQPAWIELEITESLLIDEEGEVLGTLNTFREMGITIAIDDFGTGYSALSYLARFPIDTLKIDRSFTGRVSEYGHHAELVKAIISIANCLGQKVVAEGVETVEQEQFLQAYGCHIAQGYLYSKPVPQTSFEQLPRAYLH